MLALHGLLGIVCAKRTGRAAAGCRASFRRNLAEKKSHAAPHRQTPGKGTPPTTWPQGLTRLPGAIRERETAVFGTLQQLVVRRGLRGKDTAGSVRASSKYNRWSLLQRAVTQVPCGQLLLPQGALPPLQRSCAPPARGRSKEGERQRQVRQRRLPKSRRRPGALLDLPGTRSRRQRQNRPILARSRASLPRPGPRSQAPAARPPQPGPRGPAPASAARLPRPWAGRPGPRSPRKPGLCEPARSPRGPSPWPQQARI